MKTAFLFLIRGYQRLVSPGLGIACRYEPSCSHYAAQAIERHGAWRGVRLAAARLGRCRPGGGHGYDPVPEFDSPAVPASASPSHPTSRQSIDGAPALDAPANGSARQQPLTSRQGQS